MRLIDADALILSFCDNPSYSATMFSKIRGRIKAAPTIDAEPVKRGEWERIPYSFAGGYRCSICGHKSLVNSWNYCPNCGAKMDGDSNG